MLVGGGVARGMGVTKPAATARRCLTAGPARRIQRPAGYGVRAPACRWQWRGSLGKGPRRYAVASPRSRPGGIRTPAYLYQRRGGGHLPAGPAELGRSRAASWTVGRNEKPPALAGVEGSKGGLFATVADLRSRFPTMDRMLGGCYGCVKPQFDPCATPRKRGRIRYSVRYAPKAGCYSGFPMDTPPFSGSNLRYSFGSRIAASCSATSSAIEQIRPASGS